MRKSLRLQAELLEEFGACVFDVTLDCEDGAPSGGEIDQAHLVAELLAELARGSTQSPVLGGDGGERQRAGVRVHPVGHGAFASDIEIIVGRALGALSYVMVPKVETLDDVLQAVEKIDAVAGKSVGDALDDTARKSIPLHVLIESPAAVRNVFEIARHPRVESVSFGLMDFVSAHGGAIGPGAMRVRPLADSVSLDQFHHPLVVRAKLEISSACHAAGKVPSHGVVTEFRDTSALQRAAKLASNAFGYTRMWSIHPDQIRPIVEAFAPAPDDIDTAARIIEAASLQDWAPISVGGTLHDRASYRYFWHVIERAHQTGRDLPEPMKPYFFAPAHAS
jgi:citrate lyase subunit beta/citryl-CoA lyase